jgi:hypothetical protein
MTYEDDQLWGVEVRRSYIKHVRVRNVHIILPQYVNEIEYVYDSQCAKKVLQ